MCVCVCLFVTKYGVQAIYITMQGVLLHMYVLCEYSVRNKSPKSLQVVQPSLCCMCVCACMCVCCVAHSCTCTICENSVRNKNPKTLQVVQAQSVYVCVCACVQKRSNDIIYGREDMKSQTSSSM